MVDYESLACPGINTVPCQGQSNSSVDWITTVLLSNENLEQQMGDTFSLTHLSGILTHQHLYATKHRGQVQTIAAVEIPK